MRKIKFKINRKIFWVLIIVFTYTFIFLLGKYNAGKNNESLYFINQAKQYYGEGDIGKLRQSLKNIKRPQVVNEHPDLKNFYNTASKLVNYDDKLQTILLGRYDDNFIGKRANIYINNDQEISSYKNPHIKVSGWVPDIKQLLPLKLTLEFADKSQKQYTFDRSDKFEIDIAVENVINLKSGSVIRVFTDKTYNPAQMGVNSDGRDLSIHIYDVKFYDFKGSK